MSIEQTIDFPSGKYATGVVLLDSTTGNPTGKLATQGTIPTVTSASIVSLHCYGHYQ
jgi:hypothetical protein